MESRKNSANGTAQAFLESSGIVALGKVVAIKVGHGHLQIALRRDRKTVIAGSTRPKAATLLDRKFVHFSPITAN
jgi:predicted rRNA methylase YqxC with S4 and FtsJ domains